MTSTTDPNEPHGQLYITGIKVDDLFGRYSYDLRCEDSRDSAQLLLLYGENGTGKTTILSLVHHLISKEPGKGHRTALSRARFKRLSVRLSDGSELSATRHRGKLDGSFRLSIRRAGRTASFAYEADEGGAIKMSAVEQGKHERFSKLLPDLNVLVLPDERKMSAEISLQSRESEAARMELRALRRARLLRHDPTAATLPKTGQILSKVVQWIRGQALAGSNVGQLNVNSIYSEIVGRIVRPSDEARAPIDADGLARVLAEQAVRNHQYSKFGFTSELEVGNLINSILKSKKREDRISTISQILKPFIDGNEARLRALARVQKTVATFVDSINSFYCDKVLTFHLQDGIRIVSEDGTGLDPQVLSSGEKQLLILFCNVIMTGQRPSIFIIDEPELSLNIKWQRQLIDALLACVKDSSVQFVFATHSIEILAKHRKSVVKLEDLSHKRKRTQHALPSNA